MTTDVDWYALRVPYGREMFLKRYLDELLIENFIPMKYVNVVEGTHLRRKLVPAIHNLIFVHSNKKTLDRLKKEYAAGIPFYYIIDRSNLNGTPIIIADKQMKNFIAVAGTYDEQILYLDPIKTMLKKGDPVRITGGLFSGAEGKLMRIKGHHRLVVAITGLLVVATAYVHPSLVEKL